MSPRCWPAWPIRPPSARKTEGGSPMSMQVTSQDFEANAHKAMADPNLRKAMDIIGGPMASRRVETARELPEFEALRDEGVKIKNHVLQHIDLYLEKFEQRSEEHTSELQSLMRISYAVFCLKTKTINK